MTKHSKQSARRRGFTVIAMILISIVLTTLYIYQKPHRQVSEEIAYEAISVTDLTRQFAEDQSRANDKYLSSDGNSKILEVYGEVGRIARNQHGATIIELSDPNALAHVRCTMSPVYDTLSEVHVGGTVKIKGAITAGNYFDSTLGLQNDLNMVDCILMDPTQRHPRGG